jgi:hypothetical protein
VSLLGRKEMEQELKEEEKENQKRREFEIVFNLQRRGPNARWQGAV